MRRTKRCLVLVRGPLAILESVVKLSFIHCLKLVEDHIKG